MPGFRLAAVWLIATLVGCGGDPLGRHAISGSVKVGGAAIERGSISFQPTEGQATSGGAEIKGGRYSVPREGGLVVGKYRVAVNAPAPGTGGVVNAEALPGDPPAPAKEFVPPEWNTASQQFIEVKKEGPFVFDFAIPKAAK